MASANPACLADSFLETLRRFLATEEIKLYIGVADKLKKLEDSTSKISSVLDDAVVKSRENEAIRCWTEHVQDVLHEADDIVDELRTEILRNDHQAVTKVCMISFPVTLNHLVFRRKLELIKEKTEEILKERERYLLKKGKIEPDPASLLDRAPHRQSLEFSSEDKFIGRDHELRAIVELLLDFRSEENVSITSLVGIRGLGKTVLARMAFNHKLVRDHFGLRIWVDVSGAFDTKQIVDSMLECVTGRSVPKDAEIGLIENEIAGRKSLLVLDDVRSIDPDKWFDFKRLLMSGAEGSRVLLTTPSVKTAHLAGTMQPFFLSSLSSSNSWELFIRVAFAGQEPPSGEIKSIAEKIVRRSYGVPLIIRRLGDILQEFGTSEEKWAAFLETELLANLGGGESDSVDYTLKLSFDRLPTHLKNCFAYCSLFPKGQEIDVQTLIKLWTAQGFIQVCPDPRHNLEDAGYEHFKFLRERDFLEIVESDIWGKATKCKMSLAMHDLAMDVAGNECIKLGLDHYHQNVRDVHHVSFDFSPSSPRQISTSFHGARIRSILFPCQSSIKQEGSSSKAICDAIISHMKFLRTLDLHDSGIEVVPDHIDELKHLRYLDLSRNVKIKVLPRSITKLVNLQTLKLSLCFRLQELPIDIKNLVNLKHLEIEGCYKLTHMPRGLGQLTRLETLSQFVLSKDASSISRHNIAELNELSSLNNLRGELQIKNLRRDMGVGSAHLQGKASLQSLALDWDFGAMEDINHGAQVGSLGHLHVEELTLSGYMGITIDTLSLNKLVKLVLRRCPKFICLPPLYNFRSLKVLVLEDLNHLEYISDRNKVYSLPSLEELRLTELPELRTWWSDEDCNNDHMFPRLSKLFIEDCPKLVSMPTFPTLEEGLVLDSCSLKPFQVSFMAKTETMNSINSLIRADGASSSTSVNARPTSFLQPFSKLKNLSIVGIEDLDNNEADRIMWENLTSLQYLRLDYLPSLTSLPDGVQHLTNLRELHIWRCRFTALPEWITDLKILKKLSIWICPDLKSLPENMGSLTSLRTLEIEDCPTLLHRCQRKAGADWDKISRIPDLRLDRSSRR